MDASDLAVTVELKTPRAAPTTEQGGLSSEKPPPAAEKGLAPEFHLPGLDDLCSRTRVPSDASNFSRRWSSCSGSPGPEHSDATFGLDLVQGPPAVKVFTHKRTRSVRSSPVQE